jgi:hypothetical protein
VLIGIYGGEFSVEYVEVGMQPQDAACQHRRTRKGAAGNQICLVMLNLVALLHVANRYILLCCDGIWY